MESTLKRVYPHSTLPISAKISTTSNDVPKIVFMIFIIKYEYLK